MTRALIFLLLSVSLHAQGFIAPFSNMKSGAAAPYVPPWGTLSQPFDSVMTWIDAADSVTITHTSQRVSAWRDKGKLMRDFAQATGADQPYLAYNVINSKPALLFAHTNTEYMDCDSVTLMGHKINVFAIAQHTGGGQAYARIVTMSTSLTDNDYDAASRAALMTRYSGGANLQGYRTTDNSIKSFTSAQTFQATSTYNGTNHVMRVDTVAGTTVASTGLFNLASPNGHFRIGNTIPVSIAAYWTGYIAEVIIIKGDLNITDIRAVEAYLKAKWGTP